IFPAKQSVSCLKADHGHHVGETVAQPGRCPVGEQNPSETSFFFLRRFEWLGISTSPLDGMGAHCKPSVIRGRTVSVSYTTSAVLDTELLCINPFHAHKRPAIACQFVEDIIVWQPAVSLVTPSRSP